MQSFIFLMVITNVAAYSSGPPIANVPEVCDDLTPRHNAEPQTSAAPYSISFSPQCYRPGLDVKVTVTATNESKPINGMFFQARSGGNWTAGIKQGKFSENSESLQLISCPVGASTENGVGHSQRIASGQTEFTWTAPEGFNEAVEIGGTILTDTQEFWTGVTEQLQFDADCNTGFTTYPSGVIIVVSVLSAILRLCGQF